MIIYNDELKTDITVIDDNVIIIQTRGFPHDRVDVINVFDLMEKSDGELISLLKL